MLDWLAPQVYFTTRTICTDYGETLCNNIFTVTNYPVKIWEFFFFFMEKLSLLFGVGSE